MDITTIYIKYICSMSKTYESESKIESIEYMSMHTERCASPPPLSWPPHPYVGCHSSKAGHSSSRTGGTCHPGLHKGGEGIHAARTS